jgi:hypothetical protein
VVFTFGLEKTDFPAHSHHPMKFIKHSLIVATACLGLSACDKVATAEQPSFQCISAKITIADKQVDSVVQWNTKTGEARLLNAASFADKSTGQQGNLIGWVPLVDLQQAVQNLASQIQQQQAAKAGASASPASTPIQPKK